MQIRAICGTSNEETEAAVVADLLEYAPRNEAVLSLNGDGAYDTQSVYEAAMQRGATPIIPPRKMPGHAKAMPLHAAMRRLGRRI